MQQFVIIIIIVFIQYIYFMEVIYVIIIIFVKINKQLKYDIHYYMSYRDWDII